MKEAIASGKKTRSGLMVVENDEILIFEVATHGTVSYTHLTLPTNREV